MAAGCPAKCAKFLLIVFNIIFWLSGAALLAVGIWLIVDDSILDYFKLIYVDSEDKWFQYAAYVFIAVGAFTFITGFAGCCGAIKESPCLLGVYIFLLVIVMLVEIAAGVLAFVFRNKIESEIGKGLSETFMKENYTSGMQDGKIIYSGFGTSMNLFQQEFKCCGVNGSSDYLMPGYFYDDDKSRFKNGEFPYGCCQLKTSDDRAAPQPENLLSPENCYTPGCQESLKSWFEKNALILIGLGIGIACLEIFGIIFAVCLCRNPSSDKYE